MKLNPLPQFQMQPKEYNLLPSRKESMQPKRPRNAFVFSEKDMPGFKRRAIGLRDEEGGNYHSRSYLYEKNKRDSKRKESKKRFEPYVRRPIPKQTAIAGLVTRELECVPVENEEYRELASYKAKTMLKPKEEVQTSFDNLKAATYLAPGTVLAYGKTTTAKVSSLPFLTLANFLTFHSKSKRRKRLPRRIVLLVYPRTSLSIYYSNYSSITSIGVSENSRRRPTSRMLTFVRCSTRLPRCGRVGI